MKLKQRIAAWVFQRRVKKERKMLDKILGKSWKTSILGLLLGGTFVPGMIGPDGKINWIAVCQGAITVLLGRLMKDHNVTGGAA